MYGLSGIRAINAEAQRRASAETYRARGLAPRVNHVVEQIEPGIWVGTVLFNAPGLDSESTVPLGSSAEATLACARIAREKGYRI